MEIARTGAERFGAKEPRLWIMYAQAVRRAWLARVALGGSSSPASLQAVRDAFAEGCRVCPAFAPLWIEAAMLELEAVAPQLGQGSLRGPLWRVPRASVADLPAVGVARARAILDQARLLQPTGEDVWLASVALEVRAGASVEDDAMADVLLAKALQACPHSGRLALVRVMRAPRKEQSSLLRNLLERITNNAHLVRAGGLLFAHSGQVDKARTWLERATQLLPDWGDLWAEWHRFERAKGSPDGALAVERKCAAAAPKHGDWWCYVAKRTHLRNEPVAIILRAVADEMPLQV
jgi:pre-mRNA-processing factor 6